MKEIDIILPFYNGSKFIEEQIKSINNNELDGIAVRLIIINDASSEKETAFLKTLLPENHLYIKNKTNLGVIRSVEIGLLNSTAPYIMLCDQDDFWLPQKIQNSLQKIQEIERDTPTLVHTDLVISGSDLEEIHPSMHEFYNHNFKHVKPSILYHNVVTGCSVIFNRKLLKIALPFPLEITMHDHWLAVCAVFAGKLGYLDIPTILYRQHRENQVGAPSSSLLNKIINFEKTFSKFGRQFYLKCKMIKSLGQRLTCVGEAKEAKYINEIVEAMKKKNLLFLIHKKVISGTFIRILAVSCLLVFTKEK